MYTGESYKPFGELTADDARALAEEIGGHSGGGLEKHIAPVAMAWRELAKRLEQRDVASIAELDLDEARRAAESVRVVPQGGSWL